MVGKKWVVLGCGYVGTAVARAALARGAKVTALTRNEVKADSLRTLGCEVVVGSLSDDAWHQKIPGAVDGVLNCVSSGGGGLDGYRDSYVAGMRSVMTWASRRNIATMIYTGSSSVYPQDEGETVDENSSTTGAGERAALLLEAEAILLGNLPEGARGFVLRLTGIYGPERSRLLDKVRAGEPLEGEPERWLNLVHRDDICSAVFAAFEAPSPCAGGVFNVTDNGTATKGEMARWLADKVNAPAPRFGAEGRRLRAGAGVGRIVSNDKIKEQLGWRPAYPTFREGFSALLKKSELASLR